MGFLVRVLVNAATIAVAAALVPGLHLGGVRAALLAGLVLGVINALVRPVLVILTFPLTLLTLVVSMVSWLLTAFVSDRRRVERYR